MMNAMFVIDGKLVTPPLSDSILDGITRDSLLALANDMGISVEARLISIHELEQAFRQKIISEAFGAGTAAVVAPIATLTASAPVPPKTILLAADTFALLPIAVALLKAPVVASALYPKKRFLAPVVLASPAESPIAILYKPLVFALSAAAPTPML